MTRELEGLSVVVTGAGDGLGRAYARAAAAAGAAVVVNDLDEKRVAGVVAGIQATGGRAVALPADVSQPATGERLADAALHAFGRLDGVVNNAGLIAPGPSLGQSADIVERMLSVNVAGVIHGGVAAMRAMRDAGHGGSVVNVASGAL
jgi:NAD(P)-dependent dehydrogenase (short-subunit alcohol dehydrogenase family)